MGVEGGFYPERLGRRCKGQASLPASRLRARSQQPGEAFVGRGEPGVYRSAAWAMQRTSGRGRAEEGDA